MISWITSAQCVRLLADVEYVMCEELEIGQQGEHRGKLIPPLWRNPLTTIQKYHRLNL